MTITNSYTRQPTQLDYASPTQFKFNIVKLPKVEYFVTSVNVPGISMGTTTQATMLRDLPGPGDKLSYEALTLSFLVDEHLENYREIHGWLTGLGFPRDHSEFKTLQDAGTDRFPTSSGNVSTEVGKVNNTAPDEGSTFSDATLMILSSKNNAIVEVRFRDIFPVSLGGLNYEQQAGDVEYLTTSVTFNYKLYEFATVGSSTTTVTTT
jgi:hypothetical protein